MSQSVGNSFGITIDNNGLKPSFFLRQGLHVILVTVNSDTLTNSVLGLPPRIIIFEFCLRHRILVLGIVKWNNNTRCLCTTDRTLLPMLLQPQG